MKPPAEAIERLRRIVGPKGWTTDKQEMAPYLEDWRGNYRGQKQIWFLLRLIGRDCDVRLRACDKPEFDAWRWNEYWVPMDAVIDFKRDVYQKALSELARYLRRRADMRPPATAARHAGRELTRT